MIDFRYHIVSLISVFLALALGIVVGTTQLNGTVLSELRSQVNGLKGDKGTLQRSNRTLQQQITSDDQFAKSIAPALVSGRLTGARVLVVAAPDTDSAVVNATSSLIKQAGGTIAGTVDLTSDYTDPRRSGDLKDFATGGVVPAGFTLPPTADSGVLAGSLLADVLVTRAGVREPTSGERRQVLAGFSSLSVLRLGTGSIDPADYTVIVDTSAAKGANPTQQVHMVTSLATALRARSRGVVIAGTAATASGQNVVAAVRGDDGLAREMSTVDNSNSATGQLTTVLALSQVAAGTSGHYGTAASAQAAAPTLPK